MIADEFLNDGIMYECTAIERLARLYVAAVYVRSEKVWVDVGEVKRRQRAGRSACSK